MNIRTQNLATQNAGAFSIMKQVNFANETAQTKKAEEKIMPSYSCLGVLTSDVCNMNKKSAIINKLKEIETANNVKIIYAAEQGSRAWGSAADKSDYDVRFIYGAPKGSRTADDKGMIQCGIKDDLDMYGYDVSRVVKMVEDSNYTPFELLNSNVVYIETDESKALKEGVNEAYSLSSLAKSYIGLTKSNIEKLLKGDEIPVKSYLIILKSLLSAQYIIDNNAIPPIEYRRLFDSSFQNEDENVSRTAEKLLDMKKHSTEKTVKRDYELEAFIDKKVKQTKEKLSSFDTPKGDMTKLNEANSAIIAAATKELSSKTISPDYIKRCEKFPKDVEYRKELMQKMGLNPDEHYLLASITGPFEFKEEIKNNSDNPEIYSTGAKLLPNGKIALNNVKNGKYALNLHNHTKYSDGTLTIKELLDAGAKYGDQLAKKNENGKNNYFTLAITDHNNVNGAIEALKVISSDPKKYENLRVVLGCEISAKEEYSKNGSTASIHILAQGLNPFDEKLTSSLNHIRETSKAPNYTAVGNFEQIAELLSEQKDCAVGYAHPIEGHSFKKNTPDEIEEHIKSLIDKFHDAFLDKATFIENYYQSYPDEITARDSFNQIRDNIEQHSRKKGYINTGGLDTHGNSIFFR